MDFEILDQKGVSRMDLEGRGFQSQKKSWGHLISNAMRPIRLVLGENPS